MAKLAFALVFAIFAESTFACSCRQDMTAEDRIRLSEHIYLGRVVDIRPIDEAPVHASYVEFELNIDVVETWKGSEASDVRASMNEIYNDPSESSRAVSLFRACTAWISRSRRLAYQRCQTCAFHVHSQRMAN